MSRSIQSSILFQPIKVGAVELSNRFFFAPSTRFRVLPDGTPSDLNLEYYDKRSKYPGSLVVTEGTTVSDKYGLFAFASVAPGIYQESHIKAWSKIVAKVHANKSFISIQLFASGRIAKAAALKPTGRPIYAVSPIFDSEESELAAKAAAVELHELTKQEIAEVKQDFVQAARNAVAAGFDFVEIHGANGYLVDQFNGHLSNQRTDEYGGSIENRSRFALELVDEVSAAVGAHKVGLRISPWGRFQGTLGEDETVSPVAHFGYLLGELQKRANAGNEIAYVSVVEPRATGTSYGSNDFISSVWKGVQLRAGGYADDAPNYTRALADAARGNTVIGFAKHYTSNPDLVEKIHTGKPLTAYDRDTFYSLSNWGYNTFGSFGENLQVDEQKERARLPTALV